jgi:addiction module HigA family antidote
MKMHNPLHPGEFIQSIYIDELNLKSSFVAKKMGVAPSTFHRVLKGKSNISAEMAIRLSKVLGRSPESWLIMQDNYNLDNAYKNIDIEKIESLKFSA